MLKTLGQEPTKDEMDQLIGDVSILGHWIRLSTFKMIPTSSVSLMVLG